MSGLFVTGTDTGIGKTVVSSALVRGLRAHGIDAVGMKPVASGCVAGADGWRNDDALALLAASGLADADYAQVNPVALPVPASPHLAAALAGTAITLPPLHAAYDVLARRHAAVVVEGVGGWSVPLAQAAEGWLMQADLVRALGLPVLLVVGLRLGCINHALLSARAIVGEGARLVGWIGNAVDGDWDQADAVSATLAALLPVPALGCCRHGGELPDAAVAAVAAILSPSPPARTG